MLTQTLFLASVFFLLPNCAQSQEVQGFTDPAPPVVQTLDPVDSPSPRRTPGLTAHGGPRELAADAIVEDWPTLLGPRRDGHAIESPLVTEFDQAGPKLVWEQTRGEGYASPSIAEGRLVFTHREAQQVHIDCLDPETGQRYWRRTFPCDYRGDYIKNSGPRSSPTIVDGVVYVHGVDGRLACLELDTGRTLWTRNTTVDFGVGDDFFGVVSTPLVVGDLLIQNIGAPKGPSVVAFNRHTGVLEWGAGTKWGPSCASPILATMQGKERLFVIAGGKSRPPTGGLMVMEPENGKLLFEYPFRSNIFASVNGASPLACGDSLFLTAAYGVGSAGVGLDESGTFSELWKSRRGIALEFPTPVYVDDLVYAIDGVSGRAGAIVSIDPSSGVEKSRESLSFEAQVMIDGEAQTRMRSVGAGSILHAGGVFFVLGDTGMLATIRATESSFEVVSSASLFHAPETWTAPVISQGLLYVCQNNPSFDGNSPARLLCYDLRGTNGK
ncbi:MAG: outer membrane protein assembly factor BamB [Planctomycetota bacterium]|jgi:outer membrane protein assembly factor BamB